jgi:hypothetical protein
MSDDDGRLHELHELVKRIEELEGGRHESPVGQIAELESRLGHEVGRVAREVEALSRKVAQLERTLIGINHATGHLEGAT